MKKIFFIFFILSCKLCFAQNDVFKNVDSYIEKYKKTYDSLEIKSIDVDDQISKITFCEMFFNKLLLQDNYKSQKKVNEITDEYIFYLPKKYMYKKLTNKKKDVIALKNAVVFNEKYNLFKLYHKEIVSFYEKGIKEARESNNDIENRIVFLLTKENISIDDYNKLSESEKEKLLIKLEEKY